MNIYIKTVTHVHSEELLCIFIGHHYYIHDNKMQFELN